MILFKMQPNGAFVAGDTESRRTCYAYPSSDHATAAKRRPAKVAAEMMEQENALSFRPNRPSHEGDYDSRNWRRLA